MLVIVVDDGINDYKDAQYAIDNDKLPELDVEYLDEGFHISYF